MIIATIFFVSTYTAVGVWDSNVIEGYLPM